MGSTVNTCRLCTTALTPEAVARELNERTRKTLGYRTQVTLFPERMDDYVAEDSPVRVVDVVIDDLDISGLDFRTVPNGTGRPSYHPKMMLKLYVFGYLNRVQSSRRLEREAQCNVEPM